MTDKPDFPGVDIDAVHRNPRYAQKGKAMDIATEDRVRKLVADHGGIDAASVTREKNLVEDLGFDSLDRVELVMAVEDEFDIEIPDEDAEPLVTFGHVCDYVESRATKSVTG